MSPSVPERYEPDSENIGHGVSKTVIKHWVESNARLTLLGGTCIATDNACKLVINLIFNTIIYRIYIQYGYL